MALQYGFKVNDGDSVTVIRGEDLELNIRVFDAKTLFPFQALGYSFSLKLKKADGTLLTLPGTNIHNYCGWVRFTLTKDDTEALPDTKGQNAELTITGTQNGSVCIVQMPKILNVLPRLF